jgi:hypothetical protein
VSFYSARFLCPEGSSTDEEGMIHLTQSRLSRLKSATGGIAGAFFVLLVGSGCTAERGRPFASPQEGVTALVAALQPMNPTELRAILGPDSDEIISSGDEVADQHAVNDFLALYAQRHNILVEEDMATLVVGHDDWPMPIPLVLEDNSWWFDAEAGKDEILARRIGRNELATIETCRAIVDAQNEYAAMQGGSGERVYAQKLVSDPGQRNGLYWEAREGEVPSPLGPEVAEAVAEGYGGRPADDGGPRPYHGYCYRLLTGQGKSAPGGERSYLSNGKLTGFAVVAWPVEHENSGIMTFLVSHRGVVFQKDLGSNTAKRAAEMKSFDPDSDWEVVP